MKKKEQKINAYQLLLFDNPNITQEKKLWMSVCDLEDKQDRLRKSLFKHLDELKKENNSIKQMYWELKQSINNSDIFQDLFQVAK